MSSKNYKIIHQKMSNTSRYRDNPLSINNKYQVFLVEDSTRVTDLIEKDKQIPHISMIDRFWGHKTQRLTVNPLVEQKECQQDQQKQIDKQIITEDIPINTQLPILKKSMSLKKFKESLIFDERKNSIPKSTKQNPIIDTLLRDSDIFLKKGDLLEQVKNLKRLQVLKNYETHHVNLPGVGKLPYIINDYHSKSTNPGYSRNNKGNFFTR
ncbi:unnamed protein product [Paramecium primaurelia]|uniref:Uncharacterized protein n=1 Tax=Paramecium primaurelia TaxID=5886 RepID=A0A8S1Q730_PARPR|nr:unnamed protein product [Paramecium primaurelia]